MILQAISVFCVVVAAQVLLVAKAADLLSSVSSGKRLTLSTGSVV